MLLFFIKFEINFLVESLFVTVGYDYTAIVIVRVMFRFVAIKEKPTKRLE